MTFTEFLKELTFAVLDRSKQRGFHLFRDLRFYSSGFSLHTNHIFDVGANIGQTSREIRKYFPSTLIHAFEPIDSTFSILKENLSDDRKIIFNNNALGATQKEVIISLESISLLNSLLNEININESDKIISKQSLQTQNVKVLKGDDYCDSNDIDSIFLLKTDTEGYDIDVLRGFEQKITAHKISYVLSEVTFERENLTQTSFYSIDEYLTAHGYNLLGFYDLSHYGGSLPKLWYCNCLWALPLD